jgi:hypothetical protein
MKTIYLLLLILMASAGNAQVAGCTDPKANNYNALATQNDGSCMYNGANVSPLTTKNLSSALPETSGLIHWNNSIWSHNDDTDTKLYELDTATAAVKQSYGLPGVINKDWEEVSQDSNYVYIGDFGNNVAGNRTDLHVLRIAKSSLLANAPVIDTIWFSYEDQTDFTPAAGNQTDFDCEAFVVASDSIYLFTKQWLNNKTNLYVLPKTPGAYVARLRGILNIQGLATGATYLENKRLLVLCGYSALIQPFFYLLYDFKGHDFFSGNKRKIDVNLPFHQTEGIATQNGLKYYVSNENLVKGIINNPQKLHTFDLSNLLGQYLQSVVLSASSIQKKSNLSLFPNPTTGNLTIQYDGKAGNKGNIMDAHGKVVLEISLTGKTSHIDLKPFAAGMYYLHIEGDASGYPFVKN